MKNNYHSTQNSGTEIEFGFLFSNLHLNFGFCYKQLEVDYE